MFELNDMFIQNKNNTQNVLESASIADESCLINTLVEFTKIRSEYIEHRKALYKSILENGNSTEALNEGFSEFFSKVKEIIGKIIKFIKSLVERFITALHKIVMSEKYLLKHEKDFMKFDSRDEFDYDGYVFTISNAVPVCTIVKEFEEGFPQIDVASLSPTDNIANKKYLDDIYSSLSSAMENEYIYDIIRGKVILKDPIYKEDYNDELFKVYRNGEDEKITMTINSSDLLEGIRFLKEYSKTTNNIKKEQARIEREYKQLENFMGKMISKTETDATDIVKLTLINPEDKKTAATYNVSKDTMGTLDMFINSKINQIIEVSSIHSIAFSAKLDAIKDEYRQTKSILYKGLSKIQKRGGKFNG